MKTKYLLAILLLFSGCITQTTDTPTTSTSTSTIPPFSTLPEITTTTINCPIYSPPSPEFCKGGTLYPPVKDINGCIGPPMCYLPTNTTTTTISIDGSSSSSSSSTTSSSIETTIESIAKPTGHKRLTIASWNLQRFGPTKAVNTELVMSIASKINDYDIIIIQEITDSSGAAFNKLCTYLNEYKCIASDRIGEGSYKEQYGIIYKDVELIDQKYIATNTMAREPMWLIFRANNWTFNLITAHTRPDNATLEMMTLDYMLNQPKFQTDTILIGDLNADCDYYDRGPEFSDWLWTIADDTDTTVGHNTCTYDRLIINKAAQNNFYEAGVMKHTTSAMSDHYLIYGVFDSSVE